MTEWTDELTMLALHLRDHDGLKTGPIAERLGVTRSAVCGLFKHVRDEEVPCACEQPENRDGGMPNGWGHAILRQRRRRA